MYKVKHSKSISKRFKVTATGKILRKKTSRSHLLQKKSAKRKRRLRHISLVNINDIANFINKINYR
uniref:50S ribosomal protein L35 n=2 Tax=Gelidium TaxID=2811 RepID=A0A411FSN3_9FLOR|nr:ribosomal protein L35 [Gelidium coulteri]YP_009565195.1 ribosomal protein L35 [Gelidium sinicola]QBA96146.1 ribosomal protein L35 [Gelidium coulteri]QBA96546.1 ribosomal protein L35 [Gelidium sinicola]